MFRHADVCLCLCTLALNAIGLVTVNKTTTNSIAFSWSLPAGYFEGFHIYGNASSVAAVDCYDTVSGKNSVVYIYNQQWMIDK